MLIIDSLMKEPLQTAVKSGRAPALQFFMEHGQFYPDMVSSYPTMSVTIDSTLLTGTYSDEHRVPGLVWYDENEKRLVNYGSAKEEVFKLGVSQVAEDNFYHLNHTHLNSRVKTIHEVLAAKGLQSASINALIFRGNEKTDLKLPKILSKWNIAPEKMNIRTPTLFSYGILAQYSPNNNRNNDPWDKFGFNDKFGAQELTYFIQKEKLPAFSIAYLPELDKSVHKKGPNDHIHSIEKVDKRLQEILNAYPSWNEAMGSATWIIMGDSGQAKVGNDKGKSFIRLDKILDDFSIHKVSEPIKSNDQIVLGHNERMAFIYLLDEKIAVDNIVRELQKDERIGFTAWKGEDLVNVASSGHNEIFTFHPKGNLRDQYGQTWELSGDLSILDISVQNGQVGYGVYPDALARLYSALHSHSGNYLIVDAKPGYEFAGEGTPTHPGGAAHGSLHEKDSLVPMIVTGKEKRMPRHLRIVDLYPWILEMSKAKEYDF